MDRLTPTQRNILFEDYLPILVECMTEKIKDLMQMEEVAVMGDTYLYKVTSLKVDMFRAQDGANINCSLQTLLTDYALGLDELYFRCHQMEPDSFSEDIIAVWDGEYWTPLSQLEGF